MIEKYAKPIEYVNEKMDLKNTRDRHTHLIGIIKERLVRTIRTGKVAEQKLMGISSLGLVLVKMLNQIICLNMQLWVQFLQKK